MKTLSLTLVIFSVFLSCSNLEIPDVVKPAPAEIVISTWAQQPLLKNPVAISHDPFGKLYVTETRRRASEDLDIRRMEGLEPYPWQIEDWSMESVEQRRENIKRLLAEDSPYYNPWLKDINGDGATNWRDLETKSEAIHVLEDTDGDGVADSSTLFSEGFNDIIAGVMGGVLWHPDGIYATVIPNLWKLQDRDGDDKADDKVAMFDGLGVHSGQGGHDMHGLRVGPDGKIYWTIGDKGINTTSKEGKTFNFPNQGVLMRADPDGSNFEVVMNGLRNCQEIDFDDYGNWFCVDNDGDYEGEKERLVYILPGADAGWRLNWQMNVSRSWIEANQIDNYNPWVDEKLYLPHFEGQASYILPPIMNYSDGPCGFIRNPGTALSPEYSDYFFLTHFPGQLLSAFKLEEDGAGFKMVGEKEFVKGIMGTGLSFGPDGALYVADWQGGWSLNENGGIRKIDVKGEEGSAIRMETQSLIEKDFSESPSENLIELLSFADRRVRLKAQFQLAKVANTELLISIAGNPASPLQTRIHALWALKQIGRKHDIAEQIPFDSLLKDSSSEMIRQTIQLAADLQVATLEPQVASFLDGLNPRLQLESGLALAKIGSSASRGKVVDFIAKHASDPYLRHAGTQALMKVGDEAFIASLNENPSELVRIAAVVALRTSRSPLLSQFLTDSSRLVLEEAARAINDDLSVPEALEALSKVDSPFLVESEVLFRRVVNANLRLGTDEASRRLLRLVLNRDQEIDLRMEAMNAVSTWNAPAPLDRVDKRFRNSLLTARSDASAVVQEFLNSLPENLESEIATGLFELGFKFGAQIDQNYLKTYIENASHSAKSRVSALKALSKAGSVTNSLESLKDVTDLELMNEIAAIVNPDDEARQSQQSVDIIEDGLRSPQEKQSAIRQLATLDTETSTAKLVDLAKSLADNRVEPFLRLDIFESVINSNSGDAKEILKAASIDDPFAYVLDGGNPGKGRKIFSQHPVANCAGCHRVGSEGSEVGPTLGSIGALNSKSDLLKSLLDPSAEMAEGYEVTLVTLTNGETKVGTIQNENEDELMILDQAGVQSTIKKSDIRSTEDQSYSVMPPMGSILSAGEMRDLVDYLSTLK